MSTTKPDVNAAQDAHQEAVDALLEVAQKLLAMRAACEVVADLCAFADEHLELTCDLEQELCEAACNLLDADVAYGEALQADKTPAEADEFVPGPLD